MPELIRAKELKEETSSETTEEVTEERNKNEKSSAEKAELLLYMIPF